MASFAHTNRLLTLTTPLGPDKLLVESFHGTEGISELFDFDLLVLATPQTKVKPADLIGKRITLEMQVTANGGKRTFNGIVATLRAFGGDLDFNAYRLRVVPMLWLLTLNTQTRVFQGKTIIEIIKAVLAPYSITPEDDTSATYDPLEYCTQYRETDLQFISRLMEQFGVFYYFTHTSADHTMVLENHSAALSPCLINDSFPYVPEGNNSSGAYQMVVETFSSATTLVTGQHSLWDYSFIQTTATKSDPASSSSKAALGENSHQVYDFADSPAAYLKLEASDGNIFKMQTGLQGVERDRADAQSVIATGRSNAGTMHSGYTFNLSDYPDASANTKYIITRVEHRAGQSPSYRADSSSTGEPYRNLFTALPASVSYRSPKVTPRPRVHGCVTGQVVAPSGDESYLDKFGRVCVQFWWDRERKPNTTDNTLLRVAQSWASNGFGSYFWPRIGDEVIIDFIEGDPDAPIVVGCVYNGTSLPKYDPASQYTRSGIVTRSSKEGAAANANELRFEDLKGSEQIFVNAEKDFDLHVENDNHWQVDNDQHSTVTGNRYESVGADHHSKVTGSVTEEVDTDHNLAVKGKQAIAITGDKGESISGDHMLAVSGAASANYSQALNEKVGMNYSLQVGMSHYNKSGMAYTVDSGESVYIKGGMTVVIEAGMNLCLSGPGGFIMIGPEGVMIQGMMVMINSGGAAVPGVPGQPQDPQAPAAPKSPTAPTWPGDDPRAS